MIEQLKTIREALKLSMPRHPTWGEAIKALTQLEAMVGQEPVAWVQQTDAELTPADAFSWVQTAVHNLPLYAAPVAQQPQAECRWPRCDCGAPCIEFAELAAPQQAEAVPPGYVLVPVDALHDWKGRVNTLATLSSKADRYPFATNLKQDIADAAIAQQKGASHE